MYLKNCLVNNQDSSIEDHEMHNHIFQKEKQTNLEHTIKTSENIPDSFSILSLIDRAVKEMPETLAAVFEGETMTYRELNLLTNQLAHHLRSKGVKEETMVPICMNRSLEMIIGIIGVLKAGAAYVPIDPQYPQSRIQLILQETAASLVLTHRQTSGKIAEITDAIELVEWEKIRPIIATLPDFLPAINLRPQHLAYVIFTSGSTGRPKGVLVEHAQLYNATQARCAYYRDSANTLLVPSFSFDASLATIFGSICSGGCLFISSHEDLQNPHQLEKLIPQLDTLLCVPSYYRFLLEEGLLRNAKLSKVILGGETISPELVSSHFEISRQTQLYNEYGPTETTIWATVERIVAPDQPITIGLPIEGVEAYILDPEGNPLEENTVGELHIGGKGVARGYLNDAKRTSEQFIANPIDPSNSRLYKTGDLCYRLADNRIVFVGRADNQVKINGQRIDVGEIESVLEQTADIQQAAVLAQKSNKGTTYLVAFVQTSGNVDAKALRRQVGTHLPDYMIPNVWVQLDKFPLTQNGKIDRQALQRLENHPASATGVHTPSDPLEASLFSLWRNYLPVPPATPEDDFFDLGGNSIMAMGLVASIRRKLRVDISVSTLFQQPTIAKLAQWIKSTSAEDVGQVDIVQTSNAKPRSFPLSFGQESLWLVDQMGQSPAYHLPIALCIEGNLDAEALTWSLRNLLRRHEALRTTIRGTEDQKHQHLLPVGGWKLTHLQGEVHQEALAELVGQPFDLSDDYMLRAWLVEVADRKNILLLAVHHIAFDAWSKHILLEELWAGYKAYPSNSIQTLRPLPFRYADYALWQRSEAKNRRFDRKLAYWKNKLQDVSPLQLTKDLPSGQENIEGAAKSFTIPPHILDGIKSISKKRGVTLFMTLLAGFKVLLHRYSSQEDICIGTAIAGRDEQGTDALIGYFINSLALRTEVKSEASFLDLLDKVKETTLEAYDAKEVPFEKVVAETGVERRVGQNPLFQVMFNYQNVPQHRLEETNGLKLSLLEISQTTSKFDLTFSLTETGEKLEGAVEFRTGRFLPSTIDRMIEHYLLVLESAVKNPSEKVGKLNMVGEAEEQLLLAFNGTTRPYPAKETVLDLLEKQTQQTPDKIAVIFGDQQISYKSLDEKSNQLARLLREKGARDESLVLLCMGRSLEMVIAILGILKSGAAYVPIDPTYPQQRKQFIQEDTAALFAVTDPENQKDLLLTGSCQMVTIEAGALNLSRLSSKKLDISIQPDQLAYIIYTSGSTGKPKGVMIEHRNVYSFISWCKEEFSTSPCHVVYAATSICFDLSVFEIFYSLSTGTPFRLLQDGLEIKNYLPIDDKVMVNTVPSVVAHLLEEGTDLSNVSVLNMAGEPLTKNILERLDVDQVEVRNLYGPTEDTTYSTVYRIGTGREILIGRPISNTSVYITNQEFGLNPVGVPGEICLGGAGLARGYFNRPDLTEEKFVVNPFEPTLGARMYKTGDIGRWLSNGQIEYLGRKDDQVKIRGFRIELGEIERTLQQHGGIKQAVVLAKTDHKGNPHLVGYVVVDGPFDRKSIMDFLKQRLPLYMVPSIWMRLDAFPLTPNGKIDKKKLPNPVSEVRIEPAFVAPRTAIEEQLAQIWKDLLRLEKVGIHDDFFALGGHSLLATRFIAAIRKEYEVDLRIQDLFAFPTIAGLVENRDFGSKSSRLPALKASLRRPERLPLSYNQESLWFIDQLSGSTHYHIPLALKLEGYLDANALSLALKHVLERHEVLRAVIQNNDGIPEQVVKDSADWMITSINGQNLHGDPDELRQTIAQIINRPFDLSSDYMIRASLIHLDQKNHVLVLTIHHIAFDGWSTSLLLDELATSYRAFREGGKPALPPLPFQYIDYSIWQKENLQGDFLKQKSIYWKEKLRNVSRLQLPLDYPKPPTQTYHGAVETIYIDSKLKEEIVNLGQEHSATLFMTLLTTFKVLLYRYSGQEDICVGTVTAGRQQKDTEQLIGYFINTLPIRSNLDPKATFPELIKEVKRNSLEAFENQELPFEKMVAEAKVKRNLSENPLFQVMFIFQNYPERTSFELGNLTMAQLPVEQITSKFDLSFIISEKPSGLDLAVEYNTNLFKKTTIKQIYTDYVHLLKMVVSDPILELDEYISRHGKHTSLGLNDEPAAEGFGHDPGILEEKHVPKGLQASEKAIARIWGEALGRTSIGVDDNFFEIGGQSLVAVQVMSLLEKRLGIKLPLSILFKHPTIKEMAKAIEQEEEKHRVWKSLVPIKATGNRPPLYMIHGGGANILPFYSIAKNMDPDQPVYGLQPKGLDGKEKPLTSVEAIASHFIGEILHHNPEGDINLAGYSFGGIIAFEMAQQLKTMGKEVKHLVMFDTIAYQSDLRENWRTRLRNSLKYNIGKRWFDLYLLAKYPKTFKRIKKESFCQKLQTVRVWSGIEKEKPMTATMEIIKNIENSHREASLNYVLKPYDGAIHLMKAKIPTNYNVKGKYLGWEAYVKKVHILEMEGEHTTMFSAPHEAAFAQTLQNILKS